MSPTLQIRPLLSDDQELLWDVFHVALWYPPPAPLRPRAHLHASQMRIYAENWGRPGDIGVVMELANVAAPIGVCWMRMLPASQGLAYVDESTPQLGIGLFPCFQGKSHGHRLMLAALECARNAGVNQVSLTVHPANPAIAMYEHCGFQKHALRNSQQVMLANLRQCGSCDSTQI